MAERVRSIARKTATKDAKLSEPCIGVPVSLPANMRKTKRKTKKRVNVLGIIASGTYRPKHQRFATRLLAREKY
jgi:hypothetical protein